MLMIKSKPPFVILQILLLLVDYGMTNQIYLNKKRAKLFALFIQYLPINQIYKDNIATSLI